MKRCWMMGGYGVLGDGFCVVLYPIFRWNLEESHYIASMFRDREFLFELCGFVRSIMIRFFCRVSSVRVVITLKRRRGRCGVADFWLAVRMDWWRLWMCIDVTGLT